MSGTFSIYDAVLLFIFFGGVVERLIAWRAHRLHTRQIAGEGVEIAQLQQMHDPAAATDHPPEPSPREPG